MSIPPALASLTGSWKGTYALYFEPGPPVSTSPSTVTVELLGNGRFLCLRYTWIYEEKPQEGALIFGQEKGAEGAEGVVRATFIDSWHNGDKMMICAGAVTAESGIDVKGTYAAPPGPDWGWRTTLAPAVDGQLRMTMFNVEPGGAETLAVELPLRRA
jgi:hypothetical protein